MSDTPLRRRDPDEDDRPGRRGRPDDRPRRRPEPAEEVDRLEVVPDDAGYGVQRPDSSRPAREWDASAPRNEPRRRRDEPRRDDAEDERPRRKKRPSSASVPNMDLRIKVILWGGLATLVLLVLGTWWLVRRINRAPFQAALPTYLAAPGGPAPPGTPVQKMVVVDVKDRDIDGLHFDLPADLRAAKAAEVTTVVWLMWDKRQVGTYTTGGSAYQWYCDVTVFDLKTRGLIGKQTFAGSQPPQSFTGRRGESRSGDKPTDAVIAYLRGLKR